MPSVRTGSRKPRSRSPKGASILQTGYVYHYAFAMLIGVVVFVVTWYVFFGYRPGRERLTHVRRIWMAVDYDLPAAGGGALHTGPDRGGEEEDVARNARWMGRSGFTSLATLAVLC